VVKNLFSKLFRAYFSIFIFKNCIFNIYKIVSFTGNRLYAIQAFVAASIVDKVEYSLLNKVEFSINENRSIKQYCIKIKTDRLGNIFKL
jgi:CRISPR-associated endonuclease Csn1